MNGKILSFSVVLAAAVMLAFVYPCQAEKSKKVKGPWADAKIGTTVKFSVPGRDDRIMKVIKADQRTVTIRTTVGKSSADIVEPKMYSSEELDKKMATAGKKIDDETITIMGKKMKCEVYQKQKKIDGKMLTEKTYFNRDIPGWAVRRTSDKSGKMKTTMELIEVKK